MKKLKEKHFGEMPNAGIKREGGSVMTTRLQTDEMRIDEEQIRKMPM